MEMVKIAGVELPTSGRAGWIPETRLVLTPTTERNLQKVLQPLSQGYNVLLVGDAGVGKNALIYYINGLRKHPTLRYSFNEDTLPEDLVGAYRIDPVSRAFVWSDGPLTHALRTGSTFVADEMNLAPPEVLKRFLSVFTDGYLQILEGDSSQVKAQSGFNFVATQNPAEGFEGRKSLPREIQKFFVTVFIDPYPHDELVHILSNLHPDIPAATVKALVKINQRVESLVLERKIGSRDLERYHFNLRNLNRLAARVTSPELLLREIRDIYVFPFRSDEDRKMVQGVVADALQEGGIGVEMVLPPAKSIKIAVGGSGVQIGRATLSGADGSDLKSRVEEATEKFPPVEQRLVLLESIARGVEKGENILLESDADVEPEEYAEFFATILGRRLSVITMSRGMHTADILGGLKPLARQSESAAASVGWVDGPLTAAVRNGDVILLKGLEAAGPELVEKLNMLTDDARALVLPPESGTPEPLVLDKAARVFGVKHYRSQRSTPSISRAFRNRFTCLVIPPIEDETSLREIVEARIGMENEMLTNGMVTFHLQIREKAEKREIGSGNLQPYRYGLTNLERWCRHVQQALDKTNDAAKWMEGLRLGAEISYVNEIADPEERVKMVRMLDALLRGVSLEELATAGAARKKKLIEKKTFKDRITWDPNQHYREANTGKAEWKLNGKELKKGLNIDTPETGGNTKEGEDAWYGSDTRGQKGQGEPGHGGGGWGYRTEELYQEFLKKRRALWEYNMGVSLEDFHDVFGSHIDRVTIDFDRLLDPRVDIHRRYMAEGSRVDARRYLSYLAGRGDSRIFDKTTVTVEEDRLKGVEIIFAVNKGRRIFNFEYSVATLVALMSSATILSNHNIPFGVCGYSDLTNQKKNIDLSWFKRIDDPYEGAAESDLFYGLSRDWHGDTVPEFQVLDGLCDAFRPDARTRLLVMVSDFRGARGKLDLSKDLLSSDSRQLRASIERLGKNNVLLGVGVGARALAEHLFHDALQVGGENFANLPALLAARLTELIHKHHTPGGL